MRLPVVRILIITVLAATVAAYSTAQEKREGGLVIPDSVPDVYTVKSGDTLWDISGMFLGNPFDWPEIWEHNRFIADPHWIYPGQKIVFRKTPPPAPPVVSAPAPAPAPAPKPEPVVVKEPPAPPSAPTPPPPVATASVRQVDDSVLRLLQSPRPVYTIESYMRTGFISRRSDLPRSVITGFEGGTANATKFDIAIVAPADGVTFSTGDILSAMTLEDRVRHPDTGADLGMVVRIKGLMEVISTAGGTIRCRITENFDPLSAGDLVMTSRLRNAPVFDAWVKPDRVIKGTVLARNESILSIHPSDILYIDKGTDDGVRPGDRFVLYSRDEDAKTGGFREHLGEVEAVNVMKGETAVLVVSLRDRPVGVGDRVELTARCRIVE